MIEVYYLPVYHMRKGRFVARIWAFHCQRVHDPISKEKVLIQHRRIHQGLTLYRMLLVPSRKIRSRWERCRVLCWNWTGGWSEIIWNTDSYTNPRLFYSLLTLCHTSSYLPNPLFHHIYSHTLIFTGEPVRWIPVVKLIMFPRISSRRKLPTASYKCAHHSNRQLPTRWPRHLRIVRRTNQLSQFNSTFGLRECVGNPWGWCETSSFQATECDPNVREWMSLSTQLFNTDLHVIYHSRLWVTQASWTKVWNDAQRKT